MTTYKLGFIAAHLLALGIVSGGASTLGLSAHCCGVAILHTSRKSEGDLRVITRVPADRSDYARNSCTSTCRDTVRPDPRRACRGFPASLSGSDHMQINMVQGYSYNMTTYKLGVLAAHLRELGILGGGDSASHDDHSGEKCGKACEHGKENVFDRRAGRCGWVRSMMPFYTSRAPQMQSGIYVPPVFRVRTWAIPERFDVRLGPKYSVDVRCLTAQFTQMPAKSRGV